MTIATVIDRVDGDADLLAAAAAYEQRFDTTFATFVFFDAALLADLHAEGPLPGTVVQASDTDPAVADHVDSLTRVANLATQSADDQARYLHTLEEIYGRLAVSPVVACRGADLVIAPQREGRILAERLGCLPGAASAWAPQAKRIAVRGGLLVGFDSRPPATVNGRVAVIDGVVASGVTLMAALHLAAAPGARVDIFTSHSTAAGALALARYADRLRHATTVHVGHVSGVLNDRFYAVDPGDPARLVLGDVGDTISGVADRQAVSR
ncbi:hypothetical protein [Micromonospora sp. CPCC 205556]|uniref:hypothetical protein n=1 Tax=Micromonospora sp. CPCC 205556 TaxID=3122398 RepID=UPI002FF3142A